MLSWRFFIVRTELRFFLTCIINVSPVDLYCAILSKACPRFFQHLTMKMDSSGGNSSAQSTLHAERVDDAERVDIIPSAEEGIPLSKIYEPLSFPVIALLMAPAVFGVLARLGLVALATYDGESVFPLAYVQALGCLIMGFCLRLKEPLGQLYVLRNAHTNLLITGAGSYAPLYTALTTGIFKLKV